jgi:hypothetical protein
MPTQLRVVKQFVLLRPLECISEQPPSHHTMITSSPPLPSQPCTITAMHQSHASPTISLPHPTNQQATTPTSASRWQGGRAMSLSAACVATKMPHACHPPLASNKPASSHPHTHPLPFSLHTHLCGQVAGRQGHVLQCCWVPCGGDVAPVFIHTPSTPPQTTTTHPHPPVPAGGRVMSLKAAGFHTFYSLPKHAHRIKLSTHTHLCEQVAGWQGHVPQGCWVPHVLLSTQTRTHDKALYTHAPVPAGGRVAGPCP